MIRHCARKAAGRLSGEVAGRWSYTHDSALSKIRKYIGKALDPTSTVFPGLGGGRFLKRMQAQLTHARERFWYGVVSCGRLVALYTWMCVVQDVFTTLMRVEDS